MDIPARATLETHLHNLVPVLGMEWNPTWRRLDRGAEVEAVAGGLASGL
jgi:hypothetical protein